MAGLTRQEQWRLQHVLQRLFRWALSIYWDGPSAKYRDIRAQYGLEAPSLFGWFRPRRDAVYGDSRLSIRRGDLLYEIWDSSEDSPVHLYVVESSRSKIRVSAAEGPWTEQVRRDIAEFVAAVDAYDARERQAEAAGEAAKQRAREAELARARKRFGG